MRILNLKDAEKQYGRFSMPGFRSGSMIKKLIACIYYFSIMMFLVIAVIGLVKYDFADARDVMLAAFVELLILLMLLTPVIVIGFSDHYDWHGIKLFIIIMGSWCVLFTTANFLSSFFSDEFKKSTKPNQHQVSSDGDVAVSSDTSTIGSDIIKENITENGAKSSSATN